MSSLWGPLLWTVYVVVPVGGWGFFSGRPIGLLGVAALIGIWWAHSFAPRSPFPRWATRGAAVALGAKLVLGLSLLVDHGFVARYYANDAWRAPEERSVDFLRLPATRVDDRIEFRADVRPFPLYFFNDGVRFNYVGPGQPDRARLPFSAEWQGWLHVPRDGVTRFYVAAPADTQENDGRPHDRALLDVGGQRVLRLSADVGRDEGERPLAQGWHRLDIRYRAPASGRAARELSAGTIHDGRDRPFDAAAVYAQPISPARRIADRLVRALSRGLDGVLIAALCAWIVWNALRVLARLAAGVTSRGSDHSRGRDALAIVTLGVAGYVIVRALQRHLVGLPILLSGGDDWLAYETFARDIALHGPLMTLGQPIGDGVPFYLQPLYPYFLAMIHLLVGEDFAGVQVIQRLLLLSTVWALYRLAFRLFGPVAAGVTLVLAAIFIGAVITLRAAPSPEMISLLSETLFVPLLAWWSLALVRFADRPSRPRGAWTGTLGGVTALTRTTLLAALPLIALLMALGRKRDPRTSPTAPLVVLVMCFVGMLGLVALRNGVVSGHWLLTPTSGAVNLMNSNPAPLGIDLSRSETRPIYQRLGLTPPTRTVLEYAMQAPGSFIGGIAQKTAFMLGLRESCPGGGNRSVASPREPAFMVVTWVTGAAGIVRVLSTPALRGDPRSFLPAVIALAHLATLAIVGVFSYGYRVVYPLYVMLLPYSGLALSDLGMRAWSRLRPHR